MCSFFGLDLTFSYRLFLEKCSRIVLTMLIGMKNGMEFVENPCCDTDLGAPDLGVSIIMGAFFIYWANDTDKNE